MRKILRLTLLILLVVSVLANTNKLFAQTVTLSPFVGGLHPAGNFNAGDRDAVFGFTVDVDGGSVTFKQFNFSSQNASQSYVANGTLYRSPTATFNLASPGVPVGNVKFNGTTITVDNFNETINGTTNYYYLVADAVNTSSNYNQFFVNYGANLATDINGTNYSTLFYSGNGYNFIAGTPTRLSINALTTDVASASTILTSGATNIKIFQFSITNNSGSNTTISALRINSNLGTVSQYFNNLRLYANTTNTFPGAPTATGAASGSYVNFTSLSETIAAGATKYYWLYVNCSVSGSLPVDPQFRFLPSQSNNAVTTSTPASTNYNTFNATSYTYNVNSAVVTVAALTGGLTTGTLTAGQTNVVLFGFSAAASSNITVSGFNINSSNNADQYFGNGKLYLSSNNSYVGGTNTLIGTVTFNGTYAEVTGVAQTLNTTAKFYFLVADNIGAASPTQNIAFRFTNGQSEDAVVQSGPVASSYNTYTISGNTLTLPAPTAIITGLNSAGTNNITTSITPGSSNLAVFGFKVKGFGPVTIDRFNMLFSSTAQNTFFTNGRLVESTDEVYDAGDLSNLIGNVTTSSPSNANIGDAGAMGLNFANGDTRNFFLVVDVNVYNNSGTPSTSNYAFTTSQNPSAITYGPTYSVANPPSNITGATLNFPPGSTTYIWTGNISTSATVSSNWAGFAAPGATTDDIIIPGSRPNYPKLTGASSIGDITFTGTGGSIDLNGFTMSPASITLAANANATFAGTGGVGALTPTGGIVINTGATLNISAPITMPNATAGSIKNSGTLALTGAGALSLPNTNATAASTNTGTITQAGTGVLSFTGNFTNAGTITKSSSGTFGVSGTLNNSGTITKSGTGVTTFTGAVTNTSTGNIINSGASGLMTFSSTLANAGTVELSGGAPVTITGAITGSSGSEIINSGTGTLTLTAAVTNPAGATITHSGTGTLALGGSLTNSGTFTQTSTGTLTVATTTTNNNGGIITLAGGPATFTGVISNVSGGTFNLGSGGTKDFNGALTFTNAGTMTQSGGTAAIVASTFANSGTFTATGGTVNFDGAGQAINNTNVAAVNFYNLTLSGSATKTLGGTGTFQINSVGTVTLTSNITFATGTSKLTLKSDINGSATVAAVPSTSSITGTTVSVERYLTGNSANSRGYRLLSSPVSVSSTSLITPNLTYVAAKSYTTGTTGGGFDGVPNPTFYFYRENMPPNTSTFISGNYRGVSKINTIPASTFSFDGGVDANASLPIGNGFLFFFRGDKATTVNPTVTTTIAKPTTLTAVGYLNQGNVVVKPWFNSSSSNLSYTAATPTTVRGFNLVGNPYASSIDWDLVTKTNILPGIWVYNSYKKTYATYSGNGSGIGTNFNGTSGSADIIPSGQGFFVKAQSTAAALTFTEANKVNTQVPGTNLLLAGAPVTTTVFQYARIQVFKDSLNNEDAVIFFDKNGKTAFDEIEDAEYLKGNSTVNISTRSSDNVDLAVNTIPYPNAKTTLTIPLNVNITATGTYDLRLTELKDVPPLYEIWLKDSFAQDSIDIRNNLVYTFNGDVTNTATFGRNRFSLVIRENKSIAYRLLSFTAAKLPTSVQLDWTTVNEANYTTFTVERSTDGGTTFAAIGTIQSTGVGSYSLIDPSPNILGQNLYRLKQDDVSSLITYSAIVPVNYSITNTNPGNAPIVVYPIPSSTTISVDIQFTTLNLVPLYTIKIISSSGDVVKTISSSSPKWQGDISTYKPGVYFIQVYNELDQKLVGKSKFIKI